MKAAGWFPYFLAGGILGAEPSFTDHWVATDALGRTLPSHEEVGDVRPEKVVGIFYFIWVGNHAQKVHDIPKILATGDPGKHWGPQGATHFWSEPEYGYFHASDPWVIRRDMQMLVNAGIDFIYLDVTNTLLYDKTVDALLKVIGEMCDEGIPAPGVVFTTNASSGKTMNRIFDRFYKDGGHAGLWFEWDGKPLILGQTGDPELRPEVRDFFTIKYSWAWTKTKRESNHWQWIDTTPQDYGWSESPDKPEQIPVAVASHATNSIGRSHHEGSHPPVGPDYMTEVTAQGLHFEEQWKRAHEVDPTVVMVCSWNEWVAMRFIKPEQPPVFAGRPRMKDGTWFVDAFTPEFSRDIAPMRGGHTDSFYYQMIGHLRRFRGMSPPPPRAEPAAIVIDGRFEDWKGVPANHRDPGGDTMHRKFRGTDPATIYTHTFGRNDILTARVVEGEDQVCFEVTTREDLTPHTDPSWMRLLIDADQNPKTGWQGYDLLVNRTPLSATKSTSAKWAGGQWAEAGKVAIGYRGRRLEIGVPRELFPRDPGLGFDFKWADHASLETVESLFLEGDVAPDRRFNFRY